MNRKTAQKARIQQTRPKQAFTLIELLVVIGVLCLLASLMLPALARAKIKSPAVGCLSNSRQMQLGWSMYRDDNNDTLLPNSKGAQQGGWVFNIPNQDWFNSPGNTNAALYASTVFWPYVGRDISVYRCPGDVKPSQNGYRIRSYSMNSQMGEPNVPAFNDNPTFRTYTKGSDLTCPAPANTFVFCDESIYTMNDGWLELSLTTPLFPDVPAAYLDGGCGFGFADGHAEVHKWTGAYMLDPAAPRGIRGVVYQTGVQRAGSYITPSSGNDPDWIWLSQRASCKIN
jgi:prepilin-type N-terminal cleavage/methylation domain-containing protein